uniref:Uncharacterized protein n=1 Tax=Meloidogyne graminicola TaxID=189291 RepID=A0A2R4SDE9_9BILA|nr:hypothetical protein [Meloidogyne graminicola]
MSNLLNLILFFIQFGLCFGVDLPKSLMVNEITFNISANFDWNQNVINSLNEHSSSYDMNNNTLLSDEEIINNINIGSQEDYKNRFCSILVQNNKLLEGQLRIYNSQPLIRLHYRGIEPEVLQGKKQQFEALKNSIITMQNIIVNQMNEIKTYVDNEVRNYISTTLHRHKN